MEIGFSVFHLFLVSLAPMALIIAVLIILDSHGIFKGRGPIVIFCAVLFLSLTLGSPIFFDVIEGALNVSEGKGASLAIFSVNRAVFVVALMVAVVRAGSLTVEMPIRWYLGSKESDWVSPLRVLAALLIATLSFDLFGSLLSETLNPRSLLKIFAG